MGKIDEYASGRNDGLLLALKIVEEDGVDALREEIKFRGAKGINTAMSKKELNKACWDDFVEQIREELGIQITIRRND